MRALAYRRGLQGVCLAGFALVSIPFVLFSNGASLGEPRGLFPGGLMTTICTLTFTVIVTLVFFWTQLTSTPTESGGRSTDAIDPWAWKSRTRHAANWLAMVAVLLGIVLPVAFFAALPLLMKHDSTVWGWGLLWLVLVLPASILGGLLSLSLFIHSGIRKSRAIARQRCLKCGYSLEAVASDSNSVTQCPECGRRWLRPRTRGGR
jgi:DNA-directed RNA polymerase subunit RPC12/RpoP